MRDKTVLLISPEPWDGIFVSKHHYAVELSKRGNTVYFLNPPSASSPGKISITKVADHIFSVDYKVSVRGLRLLPHMIRNFIERRFIRKLERQAGVTFNIIWNFENSRFFDFRFAGKKVLTIYHQVDLNQDFNPKLAASTADIVFAVNTPIAKSLSAYSKNVHIVPHGYHSSNGNSNAPVFHQWQSFFNSARVKAVYVGNLDSFYLDIPLFGQLMQQNTDVDFFLIGPYKRTNELFKKFERARNVQFTGRLPFNEIQPFLDGADLLLMLYRADEFKDYLATSHKVLEYLASGKTIVSSFMEDYVPYRDLLLMAARNSEIPALFEKAIANLDTYNAAEKQQQRKTFAQNNTYAKQLDRIDYYLLQLNLLPRS